MFYFQNMATNYLISDDFVLVAERRTLRRIVSEKKTVPFITIRQISRRKFIYVIVFLLNWDDSRV